MIHPKCSECGYIGNRSFERDSDGILRDVLSPGFTWEAMGDCSLCGGSLLEETTEEPGPRYQQNWEPGYPPPQRPRQFSGGRVYTATADEEWWGDAR